ncbi:hypothetical protein KDW_30540 [Dictyobacter vulcani]|uniref:Uncharacterized protein n=1 Tax=Dictyobacter vulcani TaxID=2607529 RepID=A0A5J4KP12_9CHLR|nr:hypothetical protein [Dictyobacter vulcani]GER88892.1 hypothetical protein KDW_30540 [Dictyobacter vulcani]
MPETVTAKEYTDFMALREQMKKGIEEADSEFMLVTYTRLLAALNKRQNAANALNIKLENRNIAAIKKGKKEALSSAKNRDDE